MADPLPPDAGEVLRLWLRSLSSISATVGTRIGLGLSGPAASIRYAQIGPGTTLSGGAGAYQFQIECWGTGGGADDDGTADLLARRIASAAPDMVGIIGGATVSGAAAQFPYRADDDATHRPRSIVEITFVVTP
jgi:hypothetical protein